MCETIDFPKDGMLGSFKIKSRLGEGTYGSVFLVEHGSSVYALKVCRLFDDGKKKRKSYSSTLLYQEYHMLVNRFRWHPNLPILPDQCYGDSGDYRYLALQLLEEGTLAKKVGDSSGLPLSTVALIALQLIDVLAHIHATGMVYMDLNLENVLVGAGQPPAGMNSRLPSSSTHKGVGGKARLLEAGPPPPIGKFRVYLIDFGMATEFVTHTGLQIVAKGPRGTPLFSSPNYGHRGRPPLSPLDDLISLGYLLVACCAGSNALPWSRATSEEEALAEKLLTTPEKLVEKAPASHQAPLLGYLKAVASADAAAAASVGLNYDLFKSFFASAAPSNGALNWDSVPAVPVPVSGKRTRDGGLVDGVSQKPCNRAKKSVLEETREDDRRAAVPLSSKRRRAIHPPPL